MKKFIAAALAAFAVINSAGAADLLLPAKAPPIWSWTGFYAGANGGYGWGRWDATPDPVMKGWFGGATAGFNWQVSRDWVVGIEGDFDWAGERGSDSASSSTSTLSPIHTGFCDTFSPCMTTVTTTAANQWQMPWFATVRARAGFLVEPTWLVYGTGGLAITEAKFSTSSTTTTALVDRVGDIVNPSNPFALGSAVTTSTALSSGGVDRLGFAVGAGIEKMLTQNWSVKAEYLFMDFGSHTFLAGTGSAATVLMIDSIARVGVNYKFWPNP